MTAYKVYGNSGGSDTSFVELAEVSSAVFTYERTGLSPAGETFQFKVAALNAIGTGDPTDAIAIIAASVPASPEAPVRVTTTLSSITISWAEPDDGGSPLTHYELKMNQGTGSVTFDTIDSLVDPSLTEYTKAGLLTG